MRYWELNDVVILWRELVIRILRCYCFCGAGGIQKNASFDNVKTSTFFLVEKKQNPRVEIGEKTLKNLRFFEIL